MRELLISVKRSQFRVDDANSTEKDAVYKKLKPEILAKNQYTCEFCGFRAKKFQHIHHLNDDHSDNSKSNLVVACPLCHMTCHIGFSGSQKLGSLIYMDPELGLTQAELNQLVRSLWIGASSKSPVQAQCIKMLERLDNQSHNVNKLLKTSDLHVVADFLMGLSDQDYAKRGQALQGFYFLPRQAAFAREVEYWKQHAFKVKPELWNKVGHSKLADLYEV